MNDAEYSPSPLRGLSGRQQPDCVAMRAEINRRIVACMGVAPALLAPLTSTATVEQARQQERLFTADGRQRK